MSEEQLIVEIGMGADIHGRDMTKAALRAVSDAIRHSSLGLFRSWNRPDAMRIEVTIAAPDPDAVDRDAVARALPYGTVEVVVVEGGLDDRGLGGGDEIVLVVAGVAAFLETGGHPFRLRD